MPKGSPTKRSILGGTAMFINGRPIEMDKKSLALNKREKSNWLLHILFIR
jgi:hypothetical protein